MSKQLQHLAICRMDHGGVDSIDFYARHGQTLHARGAADGWCVVRNSLRGLFGRARHGSAVAAVLVLAAGVVAMTAASAGTTDANDEVDAPNQVAVDR